MLFWILFLSAFTGSCVSYSSTNGRAYQRHIAVWSDWSSWTPCSKSCGTGVSTRSRKCYYPSLLRHKVKYGSCNGSSTMAKVCNMKVCPNGEHNFITQCAQYNNQLLGGRKYSWRPFYIAGEECVLNCRATYHRFYARLKPKLEDGTSCGKGKVCYGGRCLRARPNFEALTRHKRAPFFGKTAYSIKITGKTPEWRKACLHKRKRQYSNSIKSPQ